VDEKKIKMAFQNKQGKVSFLLKKVEKDGLCAEVSKSKVGTGH
jgi:hypothetical protein